MEPLLDALIERLGPSAQEEPELAEDEGRLVAAMKLAVTGGTGFVGAHLLDAALAAGHQVNALTRRDQPPRDGLEWVPGDLNDRAALEGLVDATPTP